MDARDCIFCNGPHDKRASHFERTRTRAIAPRRRVEVLCALHGWEREDADCTVAATAIRYVDAKP